MNPIKGTLFTLIALAATLVKANNIFLPLPTNNAHNLSLVKWSPTPFRIQYHGFVESTKLDRYIFLVDGEMVYLQPHEIAKQQFMLKQVLHAGHQVIIQDLLTNELHVLNSGEISYIPNKFECVLLDKTSEQQLMFSDSKNRSKIDDREILVSQKDAYLYVWDIANRKEPMLCIFPTIPSK